MKMMLNFAKQCPVCDAVLPHSSIIKLLFLKHERCGHCQKYIGIDRLSLSYFLILLLLILSSVILVESFNSFEKILFIFVTFVTIPFLLKKIKLKVSSSEIENKISKNARVKKLGVALLFLTPWLLGTWLYDINILHSDQAVIVGIVGVGVLIFIYTKVNKKKN